MGHALQLPEDSEAREVGVVDAADLEHVIRAHVDAVGLPLALASIDDGYEDAGVALAVGARIGRHGCSDASGLGRVAKDANGYALDCMASKIGVRELNRGTRS